MDTQASSFYGHVTLGLRIHFPYLSQPNISKICSFINLCIHPSPFWVFENIFIAFTLQVHTHFFFQKLVTISDSFSKKSWKLFLFKSVLAFQLHNLFFFFSIFFLFLLSYYHLFISFFFSEKVVQMRAHSVYSRQSTR